MKLAYLILAHSDPHLVYRLVSKLATFSEHHCFVHIDKKSNLEPFSDLLRDIPNVYIIANRQSIYWADYSMVTATLELMKFAIDCDLYQRFIILQCPTYPLKSNKDINEFFKENEHTEFINAEKITCLSSIYKHHRYCLYYFKDSNKFISWGKIENRINRMILENKIPIQLKPPFVKTSQSIFEIYQGRAQIALTRT